MTALPQFRPPSDDFNRYERPGSWTCGRACEGRRCVNGPSPSGRCQQPDEPCVPQRSLRSRRRIFVLASTFLSLAALLIMLSKFSWTEALAPGPLTLNHAQILNRNSTSNRCAACHEAGAKSVGDWALSLVSSSFLPTPQSSLCLKCHQASGGRQPPDSFLLPHGVSPEWLATHTAGKQTHEIACAACHREHQGKDHDLTAMSNQQCQTCHAKSFHSFASGHPEFTNWPFEKPSPIAFNHAVHQGKHFPAGKQEFRCQTCHVDDSRRDVKLLANFQTACASCHELKIKQSGEEGFKLFALPGMNVAALSDAGHSIGEWPEGISNDFDGTIPPAMAVLLSADEQTSKALAKIPRGDLTAIDATSKEQLAAAAEIAIASKRLLQELTTAGEQAVARRLSHANTTQLWSQLPQDVLRAAQTAWLPKLDEEMTLLREGKPLPPRTPAAEPSAVIKEPAAPAKKPTEEEEFLVPDAPAPEKPQAGGDDDLLGGTPEAKPPEPEPKSTAQPDSAIHSAGWQRSDASYSITWRPTGHADPFLKAWIDFALKADAQKSPSTTALRSSLTKPTSIGYCAQCHTIEDGATTKNLTIHWQPSPRDPAHKSFTKFSHRPHLLQPQLADCTHCHEMSQSTVGFAPLSKAACASCHTPTAAGDQCLKCHNYHVSP
jgi:cytochrome c553